MVQIAKYVSFDIFEYKIYYLFDLYLFFMEKVKVLISPRLSQMDIDIGPLYPLSVEMVC